jgi:HAD superfamily hydrolase (TIGR01490 family)
MAKGFGFGDAPGSGPEPRPAAAAGQKVESAEARVRGDQPGSRTGHVEAAFFDLDKTVIARASIMAFAGDFRQEGLLTWRAMAAGLWTQFVYIHLGASSRKLDRIRRSVLTATRGWDQGRVREIVAGRLGPAIDPITYAEALDLIGEHRRAGRRVYLVSAAPAEIVEPLARHLGTDDAVASIARVDLEGRYTGELERFAYGIEKARLIEEVAARDGVDLSASHAYSDSATDVPMLEIVGHPVAVNPDRTLRRIAQRQGWEVRRFDRTLRPEIPDRAAVPHEAAEPVPAAALSEARVGWGSPSWARWGSAAAAVAAAAGGAGAVAWRYRSQLGST